MEQQAELALADLPVAPASPRAVAVLHVPTIRPLFPADHHLQGDRSAVLSSDMAACRASTGLAARLGRSMICTSSSSPSLSSRS